MAVETYTCRNTLTGKLNYIMLYYAEGFPRPIADLNGFSGHAAMELEKEELPLAAEGMAVVRQAFRVIVDAYNAQEGCRTEEVPH